MQMCPVFAAPVTYMVLMRHILLNMFYTSVNNSIIHHLLGHILSDWMSIRDYCMTQLRTIWLHMRSNMSLGDEERSFFIMSSMYQLFMVSVY